jgi:hypothetical protein
MRTWVPCQWVLATSLNFASQILLMVPFCSISSICHTFWGSWSSKSLTFFLAAGRQPALVLPGDDPDGAPHRSRGGRVSKARHRSRGGRVCNHDDKCCLEECMYEWVPETKLQTCNMDVDTTDMQHTEHKQARALHIAAVTARVAAEARRPAWQEHGNMIAHGNSMAHTWWQYHRNSMAITWQYHGTIMAITWQGHGNNMTQPL